MLNVGQMLEESAPALNEQHEYLVLAQTWMQKWVPEIVTEIERLRTLALLNENRITELESEVTFLGGTP